MRDDLPDMVLGMLMVMLFFFFGAVVAIAIVSYPIINETGESFCRNHGYESFLLASKGKYYCEKGIEVKEIKNFDGNWRFVK